MFKTDSWSPGSFGDTHLVRGCCRNMLGPEVGAGAPCRGGGAVLASPQLPPTHPRLYTPSWLVDLSESQDTLQNFTLPQ